MSSYRDEVERRLAEVGYQDPEPAAVDELEITSRFVMECLAANELGDGILYAALHKGRFCFVKNTGEWMVWRDHYWEPDDYDEAIAAVENVALRYSEERARINDELATGTGDKATQALLEHKRKELGKRIQKLRSSRGRENCLKFAHTNPTVSLGVHAKDFNRDPWLLACLNGVIDLRTGKLFPGRQEDYISRHCPVEWSGLDADAGPWHEVVDQIYDGNRELIGFVRRLYGYGITGLTVEHVFSVHHGGGRNGKDLMFEMIMAVLGDYAGVIPSDMLLDSKFGGGANQTDPALLSLNGMRIAVASETDEGRRFSSAKVKWLTGGGKLTARGLYDRKPTRWDPTHLLVLLTNNRPAAPGTDSAFWSRCLLIHHKIKFVQEPSLPNERPVDKMLAIKLREYLPGILAWLVRGCLEWQALGGLQPPEVVTSATDEYREDENYIGQFIESCCDIDEQYSVTAKELYGVFERWYLDNINKVERFVPSRTKFGQQLMATELFKKKRVSGQIKYYGLRIKIDAVRAFYNNENETRR